MADVFISYAREHKRFVRKLHDALAKRDRSSWVDWSDIPLGTKWWEEVCRGIESADSFAFVISQNSLRSKYCMEELDHAVENNKRLAPISIFQEDVAEEDMPRTLATHQYIEFREQENFEEAFEKLIKDLDTDIEWVHEHTRLLVRAKEWESKGRDSSMLLRGSELREAEEWQSRAADKEPKPTSLQSEYILASRRAASSRYRATIGAMGLAVVFFVVLGLFSLWQWREARSNAQEAQANAQEARANEQEARTQASIAVSRLLLAQSSDLQERQPDASLLLNLEALRTAPATAKNEARFALIDKLDRPYQVTTQLAGHTDAVGDVAFSPDGNLLASAGSDWTARLWDVASGEPHGEPLKGHTNFVFGVEFSPDGKLLASASADRTVILWNVAGGKPREVIET